MFLNKLKISFMTYFPITILPFYVLYYLKYVMNKPIIFGKNSQLRAMLTEKMSILESKFQPTIWAFHAYVQTILAVLIRYKYEISYRSEFMNFDDGGKTILDWAEDFPEKTDESPVCILLPGITGSSQSDYMTQICTNAMQHGWRCVVVNYRGNRGIPLETPLTYCATHIKDLDVCVNHVLSKTPNAVHVACGISLGGVVLTNYLAAQGTRTKLDAAMVISAPWNAHKSAHSLERFPNNYLFNRTLSSVIFKKISEHEQMLQSKVDFTQLRKCRSLREIDANYTIKLFGYSNVDEYYTAGSIHSKVSNIRIPMLCLTAADDPFAPYDSLPIKEMEANDFICLILTSHGGHLGFLEGIWPRKLTYMDRVFIQFIQSVEYNFSNLREFRHAINMTQQEQQQNQEQHQKGKNKNKQRDSMDELIMQNDSADQKPPHFSLADTNDADNEDADDDATNQNKDAHQSIRMRHNDCVVAQ